MRAAYLHPTGSHFDDIYGGSGIYNFELSIQTWFDLYTWFSLGYLRNSGQSLGLNNRTLFQMVPLGFGLKYLLNCSCLRPYLGAGLGMTWIDVDNYREFVKKEINKWGVGSVFKAGSLWYMSSCCFLDFFIDYTYMDIGFSDTSIDPFALSNDADISGFSFGFGLGYSF
jgi:outer membrane protein W